MKKPDVEYTIEEVREYFYDVINNLQETLTNLVKANKMSPADARKRFDMYLNCYAILTEAKIREEKQVFYADGKRLKDMVEPTSDELLNEILKSFF